MTDDFWNQEDPAAGRRQAAIELHVLATRQLLIELTNPLEHFTPIAAAKHRVNIPRLVAMDSERRVTDAKWMAESIDDRLCPDTFTGRVRVHDAADVIRTGCLYRHHTLRNVVGVDCGMRVNSEDEVSSRLADCQV